jgi:hypothetical protein
MTKLAQDITVYEGEDREILFGVVDAAAAAVNLTGATLVWKLANAPDGAILLTKSSGPSGGIVVTNAAGGLGKVVLPGSDTATLGGGVYYHELGITDSSGNDEVAFVGNCTIKRSAVF